MWRQLSPWMLVAALAGCRGAPSSQPPKEAPEVPGLPWPVKDPRHGLWGEDQDIVADFALPQERRAPKLPDAAERFAELTPARLERLDQALLICLIEIYSRRWSGVWYRYKLGAPDPARPMGQTDWDTVAGPDALVQLRLRGEDPISLFGAEDHWGFVVSVPRVTLARGDRVEVRLWDRDSVRAEDRSDLEFIGGGGLSWDGQLPLELRGPYFALRCNAMQRPEAGRRAAERLATIDQRLDQAERALRTGADAAAPLNAVTSGYGDTSLRYAAAFVGWDDPQVRQRGLRLRRLWAARPAPRDAAPKAR